VEQSFNGGGFTQVSSDTATSASIPVTQDGTYTFRVKATKANYADSNYTNGSNPCVVTLVLSAPATLTVPATNSTGSIALSWGASNVAGASYVVEQSFNGGAFAEAYSGTSTSASITVAASGTYTFQVKATKAGFAASSYTAGSNPCVVTLTLSAPATLSVPATNETGSFAVSWGASNVVGATYVVEQSLNGGAFTQAYSGTSTSASITVTANGSYTFQVKATKAGYTASGYTAGSNPCVVTLLPAASMPVTLSVSANSATGSVTAGWSASATSGASYVLERADNGGGFAQVYAGSLLSYTSTLANGSYLFRVKAVKAGYADSAWKTAAPCEVVLVAGMPTTLSVPTSNTTGSVTAGWSASLTPGAIYVLERADNGGAFVQVFTGSVLSYTSTLGNGSYVFRVKATKSGFADSAWKTSATCNVLLTASMPATLSVPTSSTTGKVTASWSASATADATYVLERSDNGGAFTQVYAGSLRTYTETVPLPNGSYVYRVKAVKDGYVASTWKTSGTCVVTR
jgi:hypothetical protein